MSDTGVGPGGEFSGQERELIKDLVYDCSSLGAEERRKLLDARCPAGRVRSEVERLLDAASSCADDFLEEPASERFLGVSRALPSRIGRYRVIEEAGSGGMGVVYVAEDEELKRRVAIKVLSARMANDPEMQERLRWDAQTASALQHPNIVTVHEVGFDGHSQYVVMEYISGEPLSRLIPKRGMKPMEALGYAIQIASGLEAAHAAGIVHRDVKPGNIMITTAGVVKLVDFGLAKDLWASAAAGEAPPTVQGMFAGTPTYVSPEQAEGKAVDVRSDIFSFGSVLYEMLTGQRAFPGDTPGSVITGILRDDPPDLSATRRPPDTRIDEIIRRCLRKDRVWRFQSIGEVRVRLLEIQEAIEHPPVDRSGPWSRLANVAKRPSAWLLYGLTLGAILVATSSGLFRHGETSADETTLTRATNILGLTDFPALSPDGRLLAYASDNGSGNLNIWVQFVDGGEPRQITHTQDNHDELVFSPDSTRLAYHSTKDGGGIYYMPALGGDERLIGPKGHGARFSPDGQSLAYWTGTAGASMNAGSAQIYIASLRSGGAPVKFRPRDYVSSAYPLWSPGSDRLLFLGGDLNGRKGWWVASIDGHYARLTNLDTDLFRAGLHLPAGAQRFTPEVWLPSGKILFSAVSGDSTGVWSAEIDADGVATVRPRKVTSSSTTDLHPSAIEPGGHLAVAFTAQSVTMNIWQVPLNGEGVSSGEPKVLLSAIDTLSSPSISWDGSKLVFYSRVPDGNAIRLLNVREDKTETVTPVKNRSQADPVLSGDGEWVAYLSDPKNAYRRRISGGESERICEQCSLPTHLSFDGRMALFDSLSSTDQAWLVVGRNRPRPLISWAGEAALRQSGARFSPDGHWAVFSGSRVDSEEKRIWITPVESKGPITENDLISVSAGVGSDIEPSWSPDGRTIYFLSDRDGFECIWGRHVDLVTAQPQGGEFPVYHSHQAQQRIESPSGHTGDVGLSAARDSLVVLMVEHRGNIWLRREASHKQ